MSLMRQVWLLVLGVVLTSLVGSVAVSASSVRHLIGTQLEVKNADNAVALALALSQQHGDPALMELLISAQFDLGHYERVTWRTADGKVAVEKSAPQQVTARAPAWFMHLLPFKVAPGLAQVSSGWSALGSVEVVSHSAYAYDELWNSLLNTLALLSGVGLLAVAVAYVTLTRIRRPLDNAVAQAQSVVEGSYRLVEESRVPELQRLTSAMNAMVLRVKAMFEAQAEQLQVLRVQAHCDVLTGMSSRKHFLAEFESALTRDEGPARGGLVMVRLRDLSGLNQRMGRPAVDEVLGAIAKAIKAYPESVNGCLAGRLNGADFALWLPAPDVAAETAAALAEALRASLPAFGNGIRVALGSVELPRESSMGQWLGLVDSALAKAENQSGFIVEAVSEGVDNAPVQGERAWRAQVIEALKARRARLVEFPVLDRQGQLVHLECPLQLKLDPGGEFEPAARWLPLAARSRLTAEADALAVQLALDAIQRDGQARAINIGQASLQDGGFIARLRELVFAQPTAARKLSLEMPESVAIQHFDLLFEMGRQLRPLGVKLGLEHAGAGLAQVERLFQAGLDYIKLDAAVVTGLVGDTARIAFVRGLLVMLRSLSLKVYGEGLNEAEDVQALWDCELDGVTGPWATRAGS
ncbi:MAG: EAL domain-containing protein [Paucibacter sp.]|nr:EAL domain-containing protein [Roseateles sp.]